MPTSNSPEAKIEKSETAVIRSIVPQTTDTVTLSLQTYFPFKPGQSVQIQLPNDPKKRYYSLSSSPTEKDHLAVTIKTEETHPLRQILNHLKVGDIATLQGPLGKFGLPDRLEGKLIFIAAGSGVTPFRSMIKYLLDSKNPIETWLFHSVKTPADLIFKTEFLTWMLENSRLHYVPTVTRTPATDWELDTGRIGETLLQKHLTDLNGHFFLCGPTAFVADMERMLTDSLKIAPDHVRREQW